MGFYVYFRKIIYFPELVVSKTHWFAMVIQAALKAWSGNNLIWCFALWDSWLSSFTSFRASNSLERCLRFAVEADFFASSNPSVTICSCLSLLNLSEGVVKRILLHSPCVVLQGFITGSQEREKKDRQGNNLKRDCCCVIYCWENGKKMYC